MHSRGTTEVDIVDTILALVQLVSLGSALFGFLGYLSAPAAVVGCKSYLGISDV